MQKIILLFGAACLLFLSCKKENNKNEAAGNSWSVTVDGSGPGTYKLKTIGLRTNVYQLLEAKSEDNAPSGQVGLSSTLTLYFATVGPPPTGEYKVTSVDKLSGHPDRVAVYVQTYGDPRTGNNLTYWYSQEGSTQQISYQFKEGKASAILKNIAIKQSGAGPANATVSANISQ